MEMIIESLKRQIEDNKKAKENLNMSSWGYEVGVLLTTNEAIEIVKALEKTSD